MCAIIAMILLVISGLFGYTMARPPLSDSSVGEQISRLFPR